MTGVTETARMIRDGFGTSGSGLDYLANTVTRLADLGIRDRALERILTVATEPHPAKG